ncbi:MAG: RidA family protein, partial [Hyphomicrobiales bacterium]|nr:RidA family protein [Hyphomicrobiales bacterium]
MPGVVEQKLAELGVTLHEPVSPVANYVGFVRTGNLLFVSGQICLGADGKLIAKGKLGADVSVEDGVAAARGCAVN